MVASSSGVFGRGRADNRSRWCSCFGVMVSSGMSEERRDRMDQLGLARMSAGFRLVDICRD